MKRIASVYAHTCCIWYDANEIVLLDHLIHKRIRNPTKKKNILSLALDSIETHFFLEKIRILR
jgi:hypothetical protein